MILKAFFLLSVLSLPIAVLSQTVLAPTPLISNLQKLKITPAEIAFTNSFEINNQGGHLQGIQSILYNQHEYFVLSGSSSEYSYFTIVKTGDKSMVISMNKILDRPFKHAGGFQIYNNIMAIGVEDNDAKNISKVFIFHLKNPEKPPKEPMAIIDRIGTFKRATAGCVGITIIKNKVLVVVGDWDTAHLDFYRIDEDKLFQEGATLELEYSINTKKIDKGGWIDDRWLSYQNINFLQDKKGNLFLGGIGSDSKGSNILDLYQVESPELSTFSLQKVFSRSFPKNDKTKFRWGAGIYQDQVSGLKIISCGENILSESLINIYQ